MQAVRSSLTLITAPSVEPVTLAEAKAHLRRDDTADDTLITSLITAARQNIDGKDGWLGRALCTQTWELRLDRFHDEMVVPLPPLQSVTSVKYIDDDGVEQTLASTVYQVVTGEPARLVLAYDQTWPSTREEMDAVRIRFVAGYGLAASVPAAIKAALLLQIGTLYRDRESVNIGNIVNEMPTCSALLTPYRVWA